MRIESFPFLLILDPYPTILLMCVCVWNYIIFNAFFFYYFKFQTIIFRARSSISFSPGLVFFFPLKLEEKKREIMKFSIQLILICLFAS